MIFQGLAAHFRADLFIDFFENGITGMTKGQGTFKHAAIYSVAGIMGRMVGFIMLPFYSHILRGHGYAVIGMLDFGMALLISLLTYGVRGSIIRLYHDEKDPTRKRVVVSTGIRLIAAVAFVLILPLVILSKPIAALLLDDATIYRYVIMALTGFFFDIVGQGASAWLLIRSRSILFSTINLLRLFIGLSLNIWLILIQGMGLDGYFISSLVVNVVSGLILTGIALRDCGTEYDPEISRTIRGFLLPLIPGSLASFASRQLERILVKFKIDLESVGILEIGYRFPVIIAQIISRPLMQSWNTRRFEMADDQGAPFHISAMFTKYLFLMSAAGLVMAVIIKPLLVVLTPEEFHPAFRITRVEIISVILNGAYYHLTFGLAYAKHTKVIALLRGWSAALKVLLTWIFISKWGILGAAYSAAITGLISNVAGFHLAQKRYRLDLEWGKISIIIGTSLGLFLIINHWDIESTSTYVALEAKFVPWVADLFSGTFLGTYKDGKAIRILLERSQPLAEIAMRGAAAGFIILLLPLVHPGSRNLIDKATRRLKS